MRHPFPEARPNLDFAIDPSVGFTPLGRNVLSFYPLPNNPSGPYGANTYTEVLPADGDGSVLSFKVTHQFKEGEVLNARYNFTDDTRVLPAVNRAIRSTIESDTRTQNLSLIYDKALSFTIFNQARFSYGRTRLGFDEYPGSPFVFERAFNAGVDGSFITASTGLIGELIIEPFSPVGVDVFTFPQGRVNNAFQFADSLSWKRGDHYLKFGADVRRVHLNSLQNRNYRPLVVYGNGLLVTGNLTQSGPFDPIRFREDPESRPLPGVQLASIGLPSSIFQSITTAGANSNIGLRFTEVGLFFNDNWRVRPNFTLDYGLRYEYDTVPREADNRIENALSLDDLPQPGNSRLDSRQFTEAYNAAVASYRRVVDGRTKIYEDDRNNFGPRVGFAWDPWNDGKTSIRGGFGIYFDTILGALVSQSRNVFPTEIPVNVDPEFLGFNVFNLNNPSFLQLRNVPLIKPGTVNEFAGSDADFAALVGALFFQNRNGGGLAFTLPEKNLRTPYAEHWHLTLERELAGYTLSAAYVGTRGKKLTRLVTPNLGPNVTVSIPIAFNLVAGDVTVPLLFPTILADETQNVRGSRARPDPALGAYQIFENSARSNYNAFQAEARKRYGRGYAVTVGYTWSKAIDEVSDVFPISGAPVLAQDQRNLRLERADASFDMRHRITASLTWDLPFYRGDTTGRGRWLGGWQIASIVQANTGQPFTLNVPVRREPRRQPHRPTVDYRRAHILRRAWSRPGCRSLRPRCDRLLRVRAQRFRRAQHCARRRLYKLGRGVYKELQPFGSKSPRPARRGIQYIEPREFRASHTNDRGAGVRLGRRHGEPGKDDSTGR